MTKVWILVFYVSSLQQGGPAVIDNISSAKECQRIAREIDDMKLSVDSRCIEVWKVMK